MTLCTSQSEVHRLQQQLKADAKAMQGLNPETLIVFLSLMLLLILFQTQP